jgi:hypothetical protein
LLKRWEEGEDANPAIYLAASNLTVLDIDSGLMNLEHALAWAKLKGIDNTMMVVTGRANFGIHFYFQGTCSKNAVYKCESIRGDIKVNGYSVAPGAVHENGSTYTLINDFPPAPLPDWLRDYSAEKKPRKAKVKQTDALGTASLTTTIVGPNEHLKWGEEYPNQKVHHPQRHRFLWKHAQWLRERGLEYDTILLALHDLCINRCNDGKNYWKEEEERLKNMARITCETPIGRTLSKNGPRPRPEFEKYMAALLPEGVACNKKDILLRAENEGFYFPSKSRDRMALTRALRALHVTTYKDGCIEHYLRLDTPQTGS